MVLATMGDGRGHSNDSQVSDLCGIPCFRIPIELGTLTPIPIEVGFPLPHLNIEIGILHPTIAMEVGFLPSPPLLRILIGSGFLPPSP